MAIKKIKLCRLKNAGRFLWDGFVEGWSIIGQPGNLIVMARQIYGKILDWRAKNVNITLILDQF